MDKKLKERLINLLEKGVKDRLDDANNEETILLKGAGYLAQGRPKALQAPPGDLYTSIAGHRYLERLKTPKKAWLKKNWFAVSIAAITGGAALASVIVQILGLVLE